MVFGRSRAPVDAVGQHGGGFPRHRSSGVSGRREPRTAELTVEGKVVLVGNRVVNSSRPDYSDTDEGNTDSSSTDGRQSDSSNDYYQSDERDAPDSKRPAANDGGGGGGGDKTEGSSTPWSWIFGGGGASSQQQPQQQQQQTKSSDTNTTSSPNWNILSIGGGGGEGEGQKKSKPNTSAEQGGGGGGGGFFGGMFQFSSEQNSDGGSAATGSERGDDDSLTEEASTNKLFGDLHSLPSEHGEVTISGASIQSNDFANNGRTADDRSASRDSVVEKKLREICVPNPESGIRSGIATRRSTVGDKKPDSEIHRRRTLLVKDLRSSIATYGRYDMRCADISADLGDLLDEAGEHDEAIKLLKDAVTIHSVKLGDHEETTLDAKTRLAGALTNAGEYDEAISLYFNITSMRKELLGDKDPSVADGLALMAHALRKNGEHQQAIKELKRSLKIYRESLGDSHEKVSTAVDAIASLYVTIGDFEKSSAILEEVVKLKAATVGMKSKAVAETLTNLAMTYECSEQFAQAMKALKKAYKIYTEIGGYSSEDATDTLHKIALLYEATGDFNRASIAFLGVLRGRKIHHGEDHLLVGEIYCKLGHALRETGQLEKALKCMKEALPIFVGKGVEMHDVEKIAEIMHEMAIIYKEKEQYGEAARIFKQELSVRRKIGQPEFPHVARTLNHLGVTEYEMKNNSRALKYLVEALTIFQEQGEHGVDCAEVLYNTGLVFAAVRNRDRALEAFYEAERLFAEQGCKASHSSRSKTQREIVKIRAGSGGGRK